MTTSQILHHNSELKERCNVSFWVAGVQHPNFMRNFSEADERRQVESG
jgi:NADH dehydrogenase FAD-containing subunit